MDYVAPDFHSRAKTICAAEVVAIVNGDLEDEVSELSRILSDYIKHPHPLAPVRDAARARKLADNILTEINHGV